MKNKTLALLFLAFSTLLFSQNKTNVPKQNQKFVRISNEATPEKALQIFSKEFKLLKGNSFQKISSNTDRMGFTHDKYQQFFKGLKVEFGIAIVHSKNGKAKLVNGELYTTEGLNLQPSLDRQQGLEKAIQHIGAQTYLWKDEQQSQIMEYTK